jgi:hypothetical protein
MMFCTSGNDLFPHIVEQTRMLREYLAWHMVVMFAGIDRGQLQCVLISIEVGSKGVLISISNFWKNCALFSLFGSIGIAICVLLFTLLLSQIQQMEDQFDF